MKRSIIFLAIFWLFSSGMAKAGNTYQIDNDNRFILNGQPFFPLGLYVVQCANGSYIAELDEISNSPFDTLMNYAINGCGSDATVEQINTYLDEVQSRNLKVLFSLQEYFSGCLDAYQVCDDPDILNTTRDIITQKVANHKYHDALLAWYLYDEVCPDCLTQLEEGYGIVKTLDADHPVWSVHWNTNWLLQETHTTDIVGVDPYPIDNHPITLVSQMAGAASSSGKPLWLVPQIFDWSDYPWDPRSNTGRPPTKEEMRAMSYLSTNHGARGLIYYSYFNIRDDADYAVRWQEIKDIATEIDTFRPVFMSAEETQIDDVICNNENIDIKLMKKEGTYYLFAVNTLDENITDVGFIVGTPIIPPSVYLPTENGRSIQTNEGMFLDDFGPYDVHIYQWQEVFPFIDKLRLRPFEPGNVIKIIGSHFGETQGDSTVHIGPKTYDVTSARIKLWSDTKIKIRLPFKNKPCGWFTDGDGTYRKRKIWITVNGVDSNKKTLKVMKPATCP